MGCSDYVPLFYHFNHLSVQMLSTHSHCIKVIRPHDEWIRCATPSLDGRLLLTCSDDHVRYWAPISTSV